MKSFERIKEFFSPKNETKPSTEGAGYIAIRPDQKIGPSEAESRLVPLPEQIKRIKEKITNEKNNPKGTDAEYIKRLNYQLESLEGQLIKESR